MSFHGSWHSLRPRRVPTQPDRAGGGSILFFRAPSTPVPGDFSGARPLRRLLGLTAGLWLPLGPQSGLPCKSWLSQEGTGLGQPPSTPRADQGCLAPAQHSTRGQPSPASSAALSGLAGASPTWETFCSNLTAGARFQTKPPWAATPNGQAASSQSEEAFAWTVTSRCHGLHCPSLQTSGPPRALEGGRVSLTWGAPHMSGSLVLRPHLPQDADLCPPAFPFAWQCPNLLEPRAQGPWTAGLPPAALSTAGPPVLGRARGVCVGNPQPHMVARTRAATSPAAQARTGRPEWHPGSRGRAGAGVPQGIALPSSHFLNRLPDGHADGARGDGPRPGERWGQSAAAR